MISLSKGVARVSSSGARLERPAPGAVADSEDGFFVNDDLGQEHPAGAHAGKAFYETPGGIAVGARQQVDLLRGAEQEQRIRVRHAARAAR